MTHFSGKFVQKGLRGYLITPQRGVKETMQVIKKRNTAEALNKEKGNGIINYDSWIDDLYTTSHIKTPDEIIFSTKNSFINPQNVEFVWGETEERPTYDNTTGEQTGVEYNAQGIIELVSPYNGMFEISLDWVGMPQYVQEQGYRSFWSVTYNGITGEHGGYIYWKKLERGIVENTEIIFGMPCRRNSRITLRLAFTSPDNFTPTFSVNDLKTIGCYTHFRCSNAN